MIRLSIHIILTVLRAAACAIGSNSSPPTFETTATTIRNNAPVDAITAQTATPSDQTNTIYPAGVVLSAGRGGGPANWEKNCPTPAGTVSGPKISYGNAFVEKKNLFVSGGAVFFDSQHLTLRSYVYYASHFHFRRKLRLNGWNSSWLRINHPWTSLLRYMRKLDHILHMSKDNNKRKSHQICNKRQPREQHIFKFFLCSHWHEV